MHKDNLIVRLWDRQKELNIAQQELRNISQKVDQLIGSYNEILGMLKVEEQMEDREIMDRLNALDKK